jgi:hypothetical protein
MSRSSLSQVQSTRHGSVHLYKQPASQAPELSAWPCQPLQQVALVGHFVLQLLSKLPCLSPQYGHPSLMQ